MRHSEHMKPGARLLAIVIGYVAAFAFPTRATAQELSAEIGENARLVDCGVAALVEVTITCPSGGEVLEAFVYVTQNGLETQFAPVPVTCDGTPRTTTNRAELLEGVLRKGSAHASAYVLLTSGESVSPTREVILFR
jgi:hypothetical protein